MTLPKRIADKIDRSAGPDACWPWLGHRVKGRGQTSIGRLKVYVPRLVLEEALGRPIAVGHFACHHCDNPPCCNPAHLYEGTPQSNSDDMYARGRAKPPLGSKRPDVTVRHIREKEARDGLRLADPDDWQWFREEMARATQEVIDRLIARVERGDGVGTDCEWLDEPIFTVQDPELRDLLFWDRAAA